jgi:hypothetical protein
MTIHSIHDSKHWRDRATELRSLAMVTEDEKTQEILYRLADDYDRLADRAAQRAAKPSPP